MVIGLTRRFRVFISCVPLSVPEIYRSRAIVRLRMRGPFYESVCTSPDHRCLRSRSPPLNAPGGTRVQGWLAGDMIEKVASDPVEAIVFGTEALAVCPHRDPMVSARSINPTEAGSRQSNIPARDNPPAMRRRGSSQSFCRLRHSIFPRSPPCLGASPELEELSGQFASKW